MEIRRLTTDDMEPNRQIRLEALAEFPGNYFTSLAEARARTDDEWRAMLADPKMAIFGLFDGEALAGLTAIYVADQDPAGKTAGFAMSYIRPAWRGQGHAAALHKARLDWARTNGMTRVIVSHRASNIPSARAIARSGFTRIGAVPHRWPDGVEEDNVEYEMRLG